VPDRRFVDSYPYAVELFDMGKIAKARAVCEQLLARHSDHAHAWNLMGLIARHEGQHRLSISCINRAIGLDPSEGGFYCNLSEAFQNLGRFKKALEASRCAIARDPYLPEAYVSLGNVLHKMGRKKDAEFVLKKAVAVNPNIAEFYNNLGFLLWKQARLEEAKAVLRKGIEIDPTMAPLHVHLANTVKDQLNIVGAISSFRKAIDIEPNHAAYSNLLFLLNYHPDLPPESVFEAHRRWAETVAEPLIASDRFDDRSPDPERRLKIGYVSADFRLHPVMSFIGPVLEQQDHDRFEVFCYSDTTNADGLTRRVEEMADRWRDISGKSDECAATMIREDKIDILIDLSGHTAANRLLVFARKPAPVQVAYLGYPNTTGLPNIDYRITDAYADPPNLTEHLYSEKLMQLPGCFCCYRPPVSSPEAQDLPALQTGIITFGCLNDPLRINRRVVPIWSEILKRVGGSRLILQLRKRNDGKAKKRLKRWFSRHGISDKRVVLEDFKSFDAHLRLYNRIDITLDTFPFNGHTNTCNSLWMGVPVVVMSGRRYIARMGGSLLTAAGLSGLIAGSIDEYINKAVALAEDPGRLQRLRMSLRPALARSSLTNAPCFTLSFESALRRIWRQRQEELSRMNRKNFPIPVSIN
jgi:predicted O-linked N-acetylglucosamine transferase (SPINDLY family)